MSDTFLGTAAAYPLRPDNRGGIAISSGIAAVEDSIRAIIESWRGTHLHEPWLGIPQFLFHPMPDLHAAAMSVKEAIIFGDDRVDENSLEVRAGISEAGALRIHINYSIRGDATERTLELGYRLPDA